MEYLQDTYGRECGVNLEALSLYVPEGSEHGQWKVRAWFNGGPSEGILLEIEPATFKAMIAALDL